MASYEEPFDLSLAQSFPGIDAQRGYVIEVIQELLPLGKVQVEVLSDILQGLGIARLTQDHAGGIPQSLKEEENGDHDPQEYPGRIRPFSKDQGAQ
jgi:hypothetical protein